MNDVNAQLDAMQARCDAATVGPWQAATGALVGDDYDEATHVWYLRHSPGLLAIGKVLDNELDQTTIEDAEFIAAARSDVPRLIAAVRAGLDLADGWTSRGEHLMAYSKTVPEEVGTALLEAGAEFVEKARILRSALTTALEAS